MSLSASSRLQFNICESFLFSILASLNLPAAIEDLSGDQVPKSVLEKAASVREKGGLGTIDHQLQTLPELLNRNREILDEVSCCMYG